MGSAKFEGRVRDDTCSVVRPGCYTVSDSKFLEGDDACKDVEITKVAFYSRDYCMLAYPNEKIEMKGAVEEVTSKTGEKYYRLVLGYFDTYLATDRRDDGYIKVIDG